jgi:two-component system CheB/CheR fusion protein
MMTLYSSFEVMSENQPANPDWNEEEILAMISHEIRNTTQSIMFWAEFICRKENSEEALARGLEVIRRNSHLQAQLIKQLLAFSRKQSSYLWSNLSRIPLRPILEEVIKTMKPQALAKTIELQAELEPSTAFVIGDPLHLEGVFTNLLSNAIKFTPAEGCIEVRFRCWKNCAQITVSDTGRGISAEFLPHVFDRFRQEKGNPTGYNGLGLGLAIVRYQVERHRGTISAFSSGEGKGATFNVCIPLACDNRVRAALPEIRISPAEEQV